MARLSLALLALCAVVAAVAAHHPSAPKGQPAPPAKPAGGWHGFVQKWKTRIAALAHKGIEKAKIAAQQVKAQFGAAWQQNFPQLKAAVKAAGAQVANQFFGNNNNKPKAA